MHQRMKAEPTIDRAWLIATVRAEYGIAVATLRFVPIGWVATGYEVVADDGRAFFLKSWPDTAAGRNASWRLRMVLPMLAVLRNRGVFRRVPAPIPTTNGLLATVFNRQPLALFPYFPGQPAPPNESLSPALLDEMARTIAAIHRSTPAVAHFLTPDRLDVPFAPAVHRGLATLENIRSHDRTARVGLRESVMPRRHEVIDELAKLDRLAARVRNSVRPSTAVLCHTDIGGDNLRLDTDRRFAVLDWDDVTLGPPELDLWDFVRPGFSRFADVYRRSGGAWPLSIDRLAFAMLRRHLGDFEARLSRILCDESDPDTEHEALAEIELWGFDQWRRLDERLEYALGATA